MCPSNKRTSKYATPVVTPNTMSATKNDSFAPRERSSNHFATLWRIGLRVALSRPCSISRNPL